MTHLRLALAAAALALLATTAAAQQDFSKVEIKAEKLNDTTWMLVGAGGNMGLSVGEDAVFLIDDQYAPLAPKIRAAIAAITTKPVQFRAEHALPLRPHRRQRSPGQRRLR